MPTIFTKILSGEIACQKIMENDHFLAFLDIRPITAGHTLVIPKKEVDYIFDIADHDLGEMMAFAKKVALKIKKAFPCKKVGILVAGIEVPHAHIHLIPINAVADLSFAHAKPASAQALAEAADKIRQA